VLALAGCGSSHWQPKVDGPYLQGKLQYWLVRPQGKPRATIVFLHGLSHYTGEQLVQWQKHLATEGYVVIFPREEQPSPDPDARVNVVVSAFQAIDRIGDPKVPLIIIGHSRGARIAVEAAGYLLPDEVISVFPGGLNPFFERPTDLHRIPHATQIYLLSGDHDDVVTASGVHELQRRLAEARFPSSHVHVSVVRSTPDFTATHDSVYRTNAPTRREIWARIDRLIAKAVPAVPRS
jgi:alpha-beta hydrolase superfamily lysophospholipase